MAKTTKTPGKTTGTTLTIQDIKDLATALLEVGNQYPLKFVTETDFYPLVLAWLHGRVPKVAVEYTVTAGRIDFRVGGTNPAYLELAVAPRRLVDLDAEEVPATSKTQLYGSQNKSELFKLSEIPQSQAKGRFLLLIDLWKTAHDFDKLKKSYKKFEAKLPGENRINIIYVARDKSAQSFSIKKP